MNDSSHKGLRLVWWVVWPALAAGLALLAFNAIGETYLDSFRLDLGSFTFPNPAEARFLLAWLPCSAVAALLLSLSLGRFGAASDLPARLLERLDRVGDRAWIACATLLAGAAPATIRAVVLRGGPLTDDETCYHFAAQLLASGRLRAKSPPVKLLFDRAFMINDGHLYPMYFVGWPALMIPGVWAGVPGYSAALYAALTVPALYLVARELAGRGWARVGTLLFLTSPMLLIAASTMMSHSACVCALAWMTWFLLRALEERARWWAHCGAAVMFGIAFFIRPTSAIGVAAPLLCWWLARAARRSGRVAALLSFAVPSGAIAFLFLLVNKLQNGSWWLTSYARERLYAGENGYRFSNWKPGAERESAVAHALVRRPLAASLAHTAVAMLRLNFNAFGWPSSFLFAFFAAGPWSRALALSLASYCAIHFFAQDAGVDTFGPHHYVELAWPILLLTVVGARRLAERLREIMPAAPGCALPSGRRALSLPLALLAAFTLLAWSHYVPLRMQAVGSIADDVLAPAAAAKAQGLRHAVIFATYRFTPRHLGCRPSRPMHFVAWRPNNDPDLRNDILWVNTTDLAASRELMSHFPGRRGYLMRYTRRCEIVFLPLDQFTAP